jgi:hypothetical protein
MVRPRDLVLGLVGAGAVVLAACGASPETTVAAPVSPSTADPTAPVSQPVTPGSQNPEPETPGPYDDLEVALVDGTATTLGALIGDGPAALWFWSPG